MKRPVAKRAPPSRGAPRGGGSGLGVQGAPGAPSASSQPVTPIPQAPVGGMGFSKGGKVGKGKSKGRARGR